MRTVLGLFVTMPVGGAENLWLNALRKLDRTRYRVVTCCIADKGAVGQELESEGFEVVSLGRMRGKRFDPGAVSAIAGLMRERGVDILHTHMYHAGLYGRLAAVFAGKPRPKVVSMFHSMYTSPKPHRVLIDRLLNRYTDIVVAVSEAVREDVQKHEKVPQDKMKVLPVGIDLERLDVNYTAEDAKGRLGLSASDFVLGSVGRLVEAKGQRHLLDAFEAIRGNGDCFKLVIAGPGRLMEELKERAKALEMADDVLILGERHDIPELYRAMDMYVMPSLWEGAPLSLIDAMAAGLPCVATSVGGMPELLEYGSSGMLVPPADPRAIADAVVGLYHDKARMARLGARASARARAMYGSDAMARKLEEIYNGLFMLDAGRPA